MQLDYEKYLEKRNELVKAFKNDNIKTVIGIDNSTEKSIVHEFLGKAGNLLINGMVGSGVMNQMFVCLYDMYERYDDNSLSIDILECSYTSNFQLKNKSSIITPYVSSNKSYIIKELLNKLNDIVENKNNKGNKTKILFIYGLSDLELHMSCSRWDSMMDLLSKAVLNGYTNNQYIVIVDSNINGSIRGILKKSIIDNIESRLVLRNYDGIVEKLLPRDTEYKFDYKFGYGYYYIKGSNPKYVHLTSLPFDLMNEWGI